MGMVMGMGMGMEMGMEMEIVMVMIANLADGIKWMNLLMKVLQCLQELL